jgi:hypothetical protein
MKPPFKPERAYTNLYRDGYEQTTAYIQPSIRDYMSNTLYGPGHAERAYQAQQAYIRLLQLLCKLRVYRHFPQ